jgi:hypothetical protein
MGRGVMMIVQKLRTILQILELGDVGANEEDAVDLMDRPASGSEEPLEGLHLARASSPTEALHGVSTPAFCVIVQGSKEIFLGDDRYRYDPAHYLIATAVLPDAALTQ